MTHQTYLWLHGLAAAAINSFVSGVTVVIVDPSAFNLFNGGATKLFTVCTVFAVMGLATYLKEHPLPPVEDTPHV